MLSFKPRSSLDHLPVRPRGQDLRSLALAHSRRLGPTRQSKLDLLGALVSQVGEQLPRVLLGHDAALDPGTEITSLGEHVGSETPARP
jgi:hypothetical protein